MLVNGKFLFLMFYLLAVSNKSAVCWMMLANISLPSYTVILVKRWQGVLWFEGVDEDGKRCCLTYSLSESWAAGEVCVFDEQKSKLQASSRALGGDRGGDATHYMKTKV